MFGPLEVAVTAVLPGETNHDEVEAKPAYGGFAGGKEGLKGELDEKRKVESGQRKRERAVRGPGRGGGPIKYGDSSGVWRLRMRNAGFSWGNRSRG